jgi:hypothetical protein
MSKWDFVLNKLGKGVSTAGDDFPAIRKLLAKEQAKEAEWAARSTQYREGNPVLNVGAAEEPWQLSKVINPPSNLDQGDIDHLLNTAAGKGSAEDIARVIYRGLDSHDARVRFYGPTGKDLLPVINRQKDLNKALDAQPIFWADDAAGVTKKGIPKIEDALIREREREKLFNTNNPLKQNFALPVQATELRQVNSGPSGAPKFQSVSKWLDSKSQDIKSLGEAAEEQMQGKRFFFPVKADITEEDPAYWIGEYLKGKPKISRMRGQSLDADSTSFPWPDGPNVFFADGTEI